MKIRSLTIASLLFTCCAGNMALADHVRTDYNHDINFAYIRTFSFGEVNLANPALNTRVKDAISGDLASKGWQIAPTTSEIIIFVHDNVANESALEDTYAGLGGWGDGWVWHEWKFGRGGSFRDGLFSTRSPRFGRLVVDVFSTTSRKLLWRGTARVDRAQTESKQVDHLQRDVGKMLTNLPPRGKGRFRL